MEFIKCLLYVRCHAKLFKTNNFIRQKTEAQRASLNSHSLAMIELIQRLGGGYRRVCKSH